MRCEVHHTELEIDAIRGLVCPHCDRAADQRAREVFIRVRVRLARLWRRIVGRETRH